MGIAEELKKITDNAKRKAGEFQGNVNSGRLSNAVSKGGNQKTYQPTQSNGPVFTSGKGFNHAKEEIDNAYANRPASSATGNTGFIGYNNANNGMIVPSSVRNVDQFNELPEEEKKEKEEEDKKKSKSAYSPTKNAKTKKGVQQTNLEQSIKGFFDELNSGKSMRDIINESPLATYSPEEIKKAEELMPQKGAKAPDESPKGDGLSALEHTLDYSMTDPNAMAMPTGEQMSELTPEERRAWDEMTKGAGVMTAAAIPAMATGNLPFLAALGGASGYDLFSGDAEKYIDQAGEEAQARIANDNADKEEAEKAAEKAAEEKLLGRPVSDFDQMYQNEIMNAFWEDPEYAKNFKDVFGDDYNSWGKFASLEEDESADDMDAVIDAVMGWDKQHQNLTMAPLMKMYQEAGVIKDGMSPKEMREAIKEDLWGDDRAVNVNQYLTDPAYQMSHLFNGSTALKDYADYWLENGGPLAYQGDNFWAGSPSGKYNDLNNADIAALLNAGNVIAQANNGWVINENDMNLFNDIAEKAGNSARFAFLPEGSDEHDGYTARNYHWTPKQYSAQAILSAIENAQAGNDSSALDEFIDAYNDSLMSAVQTSSKKRIGRKDV